MITPEHAKLIPVSGNNDSPDLPNAVEVQFNPATLKVSLSNTLKENPRNGNSRSAQYVDKSSSSLSVELIFDTTFIDSAEEETYRTRAAGEGRELARVEAGTDVRLLTKRIAEAFIKPVESGDQMLAPKRCLFQWGAFEFLGMVQSFDETLDFFAPEGIPLRATVALKLSEDRYQFRSRSMARANRDTPMLSPTGAASGADGLPAPNSSTAPIPGGSGGEPGNWRDTALFNGLESPRLPSASVVAVPRVSASAAAGFTGGVGGGASARIGIGGSLPLAPSAAGLAGPGFSFGASRSVGTGIAGAFPIAGDQAGSDLSAIRLSPGKAVLRVEATAAKGTVGTRPDGPGLSTAASPSGGARARARASVGFD